MKKILVLTPRFPYPVIGGDRLRIYKICEELSKKYELTLLSLCETQSELDFTVNDAVFKSIHRVYLSPLKSKMNVLLRLFNSEPMQVSYYKSKKFHKLYKLLVNEHDAVVSHLVRTAEYSKNSNVVSVLEMTDAISLNYKRVRESSDNISIRSLIYSLEQKKLEKYEKEIASNFSLSTFVSDVDREFLYGQNQKTNVKTYGNGVDTKNLKYLERTVESKKHINLVFIGNMVSLQNMDAVVYFAKNILPYLNVDNTVFKLKVIGRIGDNDAKKLRSISNVHVVGSVADINEACADGHIGICPMRLGAGVQNKILEYMALGLPCITSSIGHEGIGAIENKEILVANTVEEYNSNLDALLNNYDYYSEISKNARLFVERNYSWESKISPMVEEIDKLLKRD